MGGVPQSKKCLAWSCRCHPNPTISVWYGVSNLPWKVPRTPPSLISISPNHLLQRKRPSPWFPPVKHRCLWFRIMKKFFFFWKWTIGTFDTPTLSLWCLWSGSPLPNFSLVSYSCLITEHRAYSADSLPWRFWIILTNHPPSRSSSSRSTTEWSIVRIARRLPYCKWTSFAKKLYGFKQRSLIYSTSSLELLHHISCSNPQISSGGTNLGGPLLRSLVIQGSLPDIQSRLAVDLTRSGLVQQLRDRNSPWRESSKCGCSLETRGGSVCYHGVHCHCRTSGSIWFMAPLIPSKCNDA